MIPTNRRQRQYRRRRIRGLVSFPYCSLFVDDDSSVGRRNLYDFLETLGPLILPKGGVSLVEVLSKDV